MMNEGEFLEKIKSRIIINDRVLAKALESLHDRSLSDEIDIISGFVGDAKWSDKDQLIWARLFEVYFRAGLYREAIMVMASLLKTIEDLEENKRICIHKGLVYFNIGITYYLQGNIDSAEYYRELALKEDLKNKSVLASEGLALRFNERIICECTVTLMKIIPDKDFSGLVEEFIRQASRNRGFLIYKAINSLQWRGKTNTEMRIRESALVELTKSCEIFLRKLFVDDFGVEEKSVRTLREILENPLKKLSDKDFIILYSKANETQKYRLNAVYYWGGNKIGYQTKNVSYDNYEEWKKHFEVVTKEISLSKQKQAELFSLVRNITHHQDQILTSYHPLVQEFEVFKRVFKEIVMFTIQFHLDVATGPNED